MNPYRHMVYREKHWNVEDALLHYMERVARYGVTPPKNVWISPRNFIASARRMGAKVMTEDLPDEGVLGMVMQWSTPAGPIRVHLDVNVVDDQLDFRTGA